MVSMSGDGTLLSTAEWDRVRLFDASKLDPPPALPPAPDAQTLAMGEFPETGGGTPKAPRARKPRSGTATDPPAAASAAATTRPSTPAVAAAPPATPPAPVSPATRPVAGTPAATPPAGPPPKAPPASPEPAPAAPAADAIAGTWTAREEGLQEVWIVRHTGQTWTVSVVYKRGSNEAGSAHGIDVAYADGTLSFTRVFDKKPARGFSDRTKCTMKLKDGRIEYLSAATSKSHRMTLEREGGK